MFTIGGQDKGAAVEREGGEVFQVFSHFFSSHFHVGLDLGPWNGSQIGQEIREGPDKRGVSSLRSGWQKNMSESFQKLLMTPW